MDVAAAAADLDLRLRVAGRPERAEKEAAYLRSTLHHYGTSVPDTRGAVQALLAQHAGLTHHQLLDLAGRLWREPEGRPVHERRLAAALLLTQRAGLIGLDDVPPIEGMLRESRTWALVDVLAGDLLGPALEQQPDQAAVTAVLDRWATDQDFWIRRAALLVHQRPLRAGRGDWPRFARYAGAMLGEKEFFVRKAIGWVLRETARTRPDLVFEWLAPRAREASGVTIAEAVKYLSGAQRSAILQLRRT